MRTMQRPITTLWFADIEREKAKEERYFSCPTYRYTHGCPKALTNIFGNNSKIKSETQVSRGESRAEAHYGRRNPLFGKGLREANRSSEHTTEVGAERMLSLIAERISDD